MSNNDGLTQIIAGPDTAKALAIGYAMLMLTAYENGETGRDKLHSAILFAQMCGLPPEAETLQALRTAYTAN